MPKPFTWAKWSWDFLFCWQMSQVKKYSLGVFRLDGVFIGFLAGFFKASIVFSYSAFSSPASLIKV